MAPSSNHEKSSSHIQLDPVDAAAVDQPIQTQPSETVSWLLVGFVLASNLLFAGFIFGWASMLLMLQEENQYGETCAAGSINAETGRCAAQDSKLNVIYGVAQFTLTFCSLPMGTILDKVGPKYMTAIAGALSTAGFVLMAVSDSKTLDAFVPGYVLLAMSGSATLLSSFRSGFVILRWQTAIMAGINCLFDASAVMPSTLYAMHKALGLSRQSLLLGYAVLAAAIYGILVVLWHLQDRQARHGTIVNSNSSDSASNRELDPESAPDSPKYVALDDDKPSLTELSYWRQVQTFEFRYLLIFAAVHNLQNAFYFGTVNTTLENYDDTTKAYTKAFGWILPAGFVFIPIIDWVVKRYGLAACMALNTSLCIAYHALSLIPSLPLQVVTFVCFSGFRALFYSNVAMCAAMTFGHVNMGKIIGTVNSVAAVVALLEIPTAVYANTSTTGWTVMYSTSLALAVLVLPLIALYHHRTKA